jgi:cell division protease FtsH
MANNKKKNLSPSKLPKPAINPLILWIIVIVATLALLQFKSMQGQEAKRLTYTQLKTAITAGQLKAFTMTEGNVSADGELTDGTRFQVNIFPGDTALPELLDKHKVDVLIKRANTLFSNILFSILPPLLLVFFLWFFIYRQMRGIGRGAMSFGKSRARLMVKDKDRVTFKDVAGINEAQEEVEEIIEFLKDPKKFQKLGGRIPKGVILIGPPGTGKTLLAKSIAGEADVPFFSISGSDFVEMFVGVGASRVRDLFEQGKKNAPCIIFMDEIDAVGRHRGAGIGGGHDEREQTLNQLLVEMDGFNTNQGVIIVAATNRPDVLDPALLRPGRFDRQIVLDMPDVKGREDILTVHAKKITISKTADMKVIARGTPGFSGADLANLINEAALLAARQNKKSVGMEELEEARDKVRWGRERKSRKIDEEEKKITAYHEAGHAMVLDFIDDAEPLHKVTIIPRGIAYLGATMQLPEKDMYLEGKKKLLGQIAGLMGGRIAEEIIFGDITSGAHSDIKNATRIARMMVCEWGMSQKLGPMTFGEREQHIFLGKEISRTIDYSETTAIEIDKEIRKIIDESYNRARAILTEHKDVLIKIAEALLDREVLTGAEITRIRKGEPLEAAAGEKQPQTISQATHEGPPQQPAPDGTQKDTPPPA